MTEISLGALSGVPTAAGVGVDQIAFPDRSSYVATIAGLKDAAFEMVTDLCCVDYLGHPGRTLPDGVTAERFEVVVNLLSLSAKRRVRVRVQVPEGDAVIDSLFSLYPGTEASARRSTCSASGSMATPTSPASSCRRSGRATRCARTTAPAGCRSSSRKPQDPDDC